MHKTTVWSVQFMLPLHMFSISCCCSRGGNCGTITAAPHTVRQLILQSANSHCSPSAPHAAGKGKHTPVLHTHQSCSTPGEHCSPTQLRQVCQCCHAGAVALGARSGRGHRQCLLVGPGQGPLQCPVLQEGRPDHHPGPHHVGLAHLHEKDTERSIRICMLAAASILGPPVLASLTFAYAAAGLTPR
jgi:hypothetical protein